MKIRLVLPLAALAALVAAALCPTPAGAVPVFARKYGFNCTNCHSAFPRLNDWGQRFRANGYQIPGRENEEKTVLQGPAPVAMRTTFGYTSESFDFPPDGAVDRTGFKLVGLDILSAGVIGPHIGYLLVFPPQIAGSRGVEAQDGTLEMASVTFNNLGSPWLNVRVGRFEPAYAAFSVKRHLSLTPYEIYDYAFPGGSPFSETQEGFEVTGHGCGFAYATGWLNGSATNRPDDGPADVYGRATYTFGAGDGLTAGQRFGVTGYLGSARPDTGVGDRQTFSRVGVDASLNWRQLNLAAQWLTASDNRVLWENTGNVTWSGFFTELTWQPLVKCVAFARYDAVATPDIVNEDVTRWTGGARYYFADNLALHLEYSRRVTDLPGDDDPTADFAAARLDLAF
ncbi:MAG: hypothetical protein ACYDIE_10570 [Candidatus Krumholzibacteriia bacterium]